MTISKRWYYLCQLPGGEIRRGEHIVAYVRPSPVDISEMRSDQEKYSEVELSTEEFFNIYDGVRETLLSEVGPRSDEVEGKTLVNLCEDALNPKENPPKYFDFHFGFIPLYEALHEAKQEGRVASTTGSVYKVRFS